MLMLMLLMLLLVVLLLLAPILTQMREDRHAVCIVFYSTSCTRSAFCIGVADVSYVSGDGGWRGGGTGCVNQRGGRSFPNNQEEGRGGGVRDSPIFSGLNRIFDRSPFY